MLARVPLNRSRKLYLFGVTTLLLIIPARLILRIALA